MNEKILAIDIGGSKIIVGLTDCGGQLLRHERLDLPERYDAAFLIDRICALAEKFLDERPLAAGVTIPGLADRERGIWLYAPFSGIANVPIAELLEHRLGLRVFADNDVNACAAAEGRFGICKGVKDYLWLTVSNGIGGAVCLGGTVLCGSRGMAGEIGHFTVEEETDRLCGCGKRGCLEAMASGTGIAAEYLRRTGKKCSAKDIAAAARAGDPTAADVYQKAGHYIGKAVSYCVNLLNTDTVVIGGGVSAALPLMKEGLDAALERYVFHQANPRVSVVQTGLGYYAAVSGCCALALEGLEARGQE